MASLYQYLKKPEEQSRMQKACDDMLQVVEEKAWDGEWYTRAYDYQNNPVGSKTCEEGKIFIESQGWCVLGGAGKDNGRARQALESVHKRLYTPNGIILQQPAYSTYHLELGEVTSFVPGYKENGGIFCHNNTWIHLGWCLLGEGDRALEYYLSICPSAKENQIDIYRNEPYVYAQMIAGRDAAKSGESKNSWLTGTAAWTFVVASQGILGVKPDFDGLRLDPCIPKGWKGFKITRHYRGVEYQIKVSNPKGICKGVKTLKVDGKTVTGNLIPHPLEKKTLRVEVVLGE